MQNKSLMSDSYKFVDPQFKYTDPTTGVLNNLLEITDPEVLLFVESGAVTKRLQELEQNPIKVKGIETLFTIHKYLFQDIYAWAGERRVIEISKGGKQFFPTTNFAQALNFIDTLLNEFRKLPKFENRQLAEKLAEILDNINYLHPFREGNGRTQREFLRLLAKERGLILNLNPADNLNVYDSYR